MLTGTGNGLLSTTIYTVEVVKKEYRGSFSVFEGVKRSLGMILIYAIGAFLPWYNIAYIGLAVPLVALFLLLLSPESPIFLVSKGRMEKAEQSLKRLNNADADITKDLSEIANRLENIGSNNNDTKNTSNNDTKKENKLKIIQNIGEHPEIYKPFLIITLLR